MDILSILASFAQESLGSEKNLSLLVSGEADLAVVKSPEFNQFFIKSSREVQNRIDFVANIHDEYLTILAQKKLKIKSISDFTDKIVNIGSIGSTSALIIEKYFSPFSIEPKEVVNFSAAKSFERLCRKNLIQSIKDIRTNHKSFFNNTEFVMMQDLEQILGSFN